ncbi:MAG: glutamate-1-semialdehyde 2,1-aminomutase [Clostridia bacterium]
MSNLFEKAKTLMPGGVNSPVRAFKSVGIDPLFIDHAQGSKIYDIDGNEYIDYVCSWGPMILGHNNDKILQSVEKAVKKGLSFGATTTAEVTMAELIVNSVPNIEMVRMVNSGTEAVMSALRLARGYTGKNKIIKFDGCYHGHSDSMLVSAGSGALTFSNPDSRGVTKEQAQDTLIAQFNDINSVKQLFEANKNEIAAVIVEPVAANMGLVLPQDGFLQDLRNLCDEYSSLLIFDEVITGFRMALGGAQQYFDVKADIVTFGKIIGGGMPVGAYASTTEIMQQIAPLGPVYQAGTLSGNPVAMAAGIAQLEILQDENIYSEIDEKAVYLSNKLKNIVQKHDVSISINQISSLVGVFFTKENVDCFAKAKTSNTSLYAKYFKGMLDNGINLAPAQFEAMFVSFSHSKEDLDKTASAFEKTITQMKENGDF